VGETSVVVALSLWLLAIAPQWVLGLWGARALPRIRQAIARSVGWKVVAFASWMASILLAVWGTVVVCRDLLGPGRLGIQRVVANATLVGEGLLMVAMVVVRWKTRTAGEPPPPPRRVLSRRQLWTGWLGWSAATVVFLALILGPFAGRSSGADFWRVLAVALFAIVLSVKLARRARHEEPRPPGG
jgi:hypothetical protein